MRRQDLSYPVSIGNQPTNSPFRQPVYFSIAKGGDPTAIRFVEHGSKLKRVRVVTQRVLTHKLSQGLVMMAARYAAARGWKSVYIVRDEYRGWQHESNITFLNRDQIRNIRTRDAWFHKRPIFDLEEIQRYLNP